MKHTLFIALFFTGFTFSSPAQQDCVVKLKDIQGVYTGECLNGKANGKGKSAGIDMYEGDFKEGYPEGKGVYTWKDGHYFNGIFKKGNKEGKGDMYFKNTAGEDSVISGYWKKDKYYGQYEKRFEVVSNTSRIDKIECNLIDQRGDNILITIHQRTSSGNPLSYNIPVPIITRINEIKGTYYTKSNQSLTNSSMTKVQQVTFPFQAIFYLSNGESAEILFNEKGNYEVYIDMP